MPVDDQWPWGDQPVCLVTGASRGLGLAVAEALAAGGALVWLSARRRADAEAAVAGRPEAAGLRALPVDLDVSDRGALEAARDALVAAGGRLDVLVNNAAAYVDWSEVASSADLDRSKEVMATNLYGAWGATQALLPLLRSSAHPRVVNVASGAGSHGDERYGLSARGGSAASYGVSKAALLALTATLAAELAGTPVLVNAVDPDLTATWPGAEAMGARPVADSVAGIVWAATLPDGGPTGGFFRDGRPHPW